MEVPPIVPRIVPQSFFVSTEGYVWSQLSGPAGVCWWRCGTSHTQWTSSTSSPHRGRVDYEYWPGTIVDVPVIMLFVFQQSKSYVYCGAIQFLDRVPDIPVVPQKGDSTVQSLNKVVNVGCARQLPMVQTVLQLRSPTRSSTSLFSRSEQDVPQIQSSTELNDNLEQGWGFFRRILRHFRAPSGLSRS